MAGPAVEGGCIEVEGIHKRYGDNHVLRGVDLTVEPGEVYCLLGPNGAGKTTTVEILEGYRHADRGRLRVLGFDPARHPVELRERTGVVLQSCGFPVHLRVGEVVDAWRNYYPKPRPLGELLEVVELTTERSTLVRHLSGGQRRRLDFALALAGDPDLVFLDEPTTGFDPEARRRCWRAIQNLRSLGTTIVLTTHYLDEAEHLADRVSVLTRGVISAVGTPAQLASAAGVPTLISFAAHHPPSGAASAEIVVTDGRARVLTRDPSETLRRLFDTYGTLEDLAVAPPRLEDAYLQLVGETHAR